VAAQFIAKDPTRANRWVIFTRETDGLYRRLYSTNRGTVPGAKRIPWPASYASDDLTDRIRVLSST